MASRTQGASSDGISRPMDSEEEVYMVEPLNSLPPNVARPIYLNPFPSFQPFSSVPPYTGQPLPPHRFLSPQPLNNIPFSSPFMPPRPYVSPQPLNSIPSYVSRSMPYHPFLSSEFLQSVPPNYGGEAVPPYRFRSLRPLNSVPPQVSQPMPHHPFLPSESLNSVPPHASQPIPSRSFPSPQDPFRPSPTPFYPSPSPHSQFPSSSRRPSETLANPSIIHLPSNSQQELENLLHVTKSGVALTGSASIGLIGPQIGKIDFGESEDSYFFRMSLPGVSQENFSCDIKDDGEVTVKGVTITGDRIIRRDSQVYVMITRNFCPPGEFSISFQLPGPVDHHQFNGNFQTDGILVGIVKKKRNGQEVNADSQLSVQQTSS